MTGDEYKMWMDMLMGAVRTINLVPIQTLRDQLGYAETMSPLLEPTAYQRGGAQNLRDQGELLRALAEVQRVSLSIAGRKAA